MKYNIHVTLMSDLARMVRKLTGKTMPFATATKYAIERTLEMSGANSMLETVVMLDEVEYEQAGNHMLFVETVELQEMFLTSGFRLEGRRFKLPYESFIINTPANGDVLAFMVSHMTIPLRKKAMRGLIMKAGQKGRDAELDPGSGEEGITVTMRFRDKYIRASIPWSKLGVAAMSDTPEKFHEALGTYPGLCLGLDDEDRNELIKALRLLCGAAAYLECCPDMLKPGMPVAMHDIPDRATSKGVRSFAVISEPPGMKRRDGVKTHQRRWFYRLYPLKKDGTRTEGLVFVHDCVINANAEIETITEGEKDNGRQEMEELCDMA